MEFKEEITVAVLLEKLNLIAFIQTLDEDVPSESPPLELPKSSIKSLNKRKISGEY